MVNANVDVRKGISPMVMLASQKIWNERNVSVFCNKESPPTRVVAIIKEEAKTWVLAGASFLGNINPGE